MELEFTDEQEELRTSVRSFLEKECSLDLVRAVVESGEPADLLWESMVALDWPALAVPEEYGGVGLSIVETAVVVEELGRAVAPGPLLPTLTQFVPMVREVGTEDQRRTFLSGVASGTVAGAVALNDHPLGSSVDQVTMTAERAEGGWVLDGTKLAVMAPEGVSEVIVVARAKGGVGAFVVPAAEAGLVRMRSLDDSRPLCTAVLTQVMVPDDRALGDPGSAESDRGIRRAVEEATLGVALETVGACDALFQLVLAYVKDRKQFGVPVGSFQAIKHKMTDMFLSVERARSLCYFAVAAVEEDTMDRPVAVSMAKAASDDCQHLVCGESLQSFGGIGFTWEHDCHLFMKRAETDGALFGGSAQHSLAVAGAYGVFGA